MSALRVLVAIAAPREAGSIDANATWNELNAALRPLADALQLGRARGTEREIGAQLAHGWDVLHLVSPVRGPQQYATIALETADGLGRPVTSGFLAKFLSGHPSLRLVVVQTLRDDALLARGVVAGLVQAGLKAAAHAGMSGSGVRELYAALARGHSLDDAAKASGGWIRFAAGQMAPAGTARPGSVEPAPVLTAEVRGSAEQEIERKRRLGRFDVFLCHNTADKPEVRTIARLLLQHGILPWLDEWDLPPGKPWQRLLEEHIGKIGSVAVFVGPDGVGPWQRHEADAFLREFNRRECAIIPVLLRGAPREPHLPLFLQGMTWVDFRVAEPDPLARLRWGITGEAPAVTGAG
jgi:hypothetical protein